MATLGMSEVRICNMALSRIGAGAIESLTEGSAESDECDLWYDYARKQALVANDWNFARKRLTLTTHTEDPDATWGFRYQYPSDCVSFRFLENPVRAGADAVPFEIELDTAGDALSILTDLDEAIGIYTRNLVTVTLFSEWFVEMFATALAAKIAYSLTAKTELENIMSERFVSLSLFAQASNYNTIFCNLQKLITVIIYNTLDYFSAVAQRPNQSATRIRAYE